MSQKSFTLIELLVTTGIIILLLALMLPNYKAGQHSAVLERSIHKLAQDLRRAQEFAVSAHEFQGQAVPAGYGIYFNLSELDKCILFANLEHDAQDPKYEPGLDAIVEEIPFETGAKITSLSSSPLTIIFVPPGPEIIIVPYASQASIVLNAQRTVSINKAGLIEIE